MRKVIFGIAVLLLGTATTALAAAPAAVGQSAASGGTACQQIESTLASIQSALPEAATNPSMLKAKIGTYAGKLEMEVAAAPPSVKTAVTGFVTELKAAGAGHINIAKLTASAKAIGTACATATAPSGGAPTGGGSTAGPQDTVLFGAGAAAIVAGGGLLIRARRSRIRSHS